MNRSVNLQMLKIKALKGFSVQVEGSSMQPLLAENDEVFIKAQTAYGVGDIILFEYKNDGFLAHRILKIVNGHFFCKGDNSFRLEEVVQDQIIGKIILCNGKNIRPFNQSLLDLSYAVYIEYEKNGHSKTRTIFSPTYIKWKRAIDNLE